MAGLQERFVAWFYGYFFPFKEGQDPEEFLHTVFDLQAKGEFPTLFDLQYAVYCAVGITLVRFVLEYIIFTPLAHSSFGKIPRVRQAPPPLSPEFPVAYARGKHPSEATVRRLSSATGASVDDVYQWFRQRRQEDSQRLKVKKFTEAAWRLVAYSVFCFYGFYVHIYHTDWLYDTLNCWIGYPFQEFSAPLRFYYYVQIGLYLHLLVSQFFDIKRKDFWEMFVHHIATLGLLIFSFLVNFVRIGGLVLLVHDPSDIFLESAKLFNYAKWQKTCDALFAGFAITFFVFRLIIYPFHVFRSAAFESYATVGPFSSWYFFNGLLFVLQCLHVFWFQIIARMVYQSLREGKVAKDSRSDSDSESEDEDNKDQ